MVYALALGASVARHEGSTPSIRTCSNQQVLNDNQAFCTQAWRIKCL